MGNFKRGLLFGGLLGAGLAWLNLTKQGKAVRDEAIGHAAVVYERVKKDLLKSEAWKKMKKSDFAKKVEQFTKEYAREIGLATSTVSLIVSLIVKQWEKLKQEL